MLQVEDRIISLEKAIQIRNECKEKGKSIVFTNGCFDILHKGHAFYLEKAAALGDILILGLNSDKSVKKLKGPDRPINNEKSRAYLLAALRSVDFVVLFDEDTPYNVIRGIIPDILIKGGDYKTEDIVGGDIVSDAGGKVMTIKFVEGFSTTNIINKISN